MPRHDSEAVLTTHNPSSTAYGGRRAKVCPPSTQRPAPCPRDPQAELEQRRASARHFVGLAEVSRARHVLTAAPIAPGDTNTLRELTDPARRPPSLQQALPDDLLAFEPQNALRLDRQLLIDTVRGCHRGSAAGLSGLTGEHLRVLLEDTDALEQQMRMHALISQLQSQPHFVWRV